VSASKVVVAAKFGGRPYLIAATSSGPKVKVRMTMSPGGGGDGGTASNSLFGWLVANGWCWFVLREEYCWLVSGGWFVLREKYY
jgi:hypothetical protein